MATWTIWICLSLSATAQVAEPRASVVLDSSGTVRELLGSPSSFVPGAILAKSAMAAAACGIHTLIKLDHSVHFDDNVFDAPSGSALIGFDASCATASVYSPASSQILRVTAASSNTIHVDPSLLGGEVLAIGNAFHLLVRRADGIHDVRLRPSDGAVESDEPLDIDTDSILILDDGRLVYAVGNRLAVRDKTGSGRSVEAPIPVDSLTLAADGLVQVHTHTLSLALQILPDRLALSFLPGPPQ